MGRTDDPRRSGGAVLLVVGMKDEENLHCTLQRRVWDVVVFGDRKHHRQEVRGVVEVVAGEDEREALVEPVRRSGHRWHLGNQANDLLHPNLGIVDLFGFGVEGREAGDARCQQSHWMGVVVERIVDPAAKVLVQVGVVGDLVCPGVGLGLGGQFAGEEQMGNLEVCRVLSQLIDGIAAVLEDAVPTVEIRDR